MIQTLGNLAITYSPEESKHMPPQEPKFPKRDLNQTAIDAIATRINSYEQSWKRRWEESYTRWKDRMERLLSIVEQSVTTADRINKRAELQIQTQKKIDALADKLDQFAELEHERDLKWDTRLTRITASIEGYQVLAQQQAQNVEKMMKLATLMMQKAA